MISTARSDPALRIEDVCIEADFLRLRGSWNDLVTRVNGHLFFRHEWFGAAWAWRRTDAAIWIICAFSADRLVGILPLLRPQQVAYGSRVLQFLSVPDTQWCDVLVDPDAGPTVGHALVAHIVSKSSLWDVLRLERLSAHSQVERWLAPALRQRGLNAQFEFVDCNLFVDLKLQWDHYHDSLSSGLKKTCRLAANRLARAGAAHVQWVTCRATGPEQLRRNLDEMISVSGQSWKQVTGNSLDRPGPQAFIRALTQAAADDNWLSLWFLRLGDKPIAMEYQLISGGHVHALRADFDDAYRNMSPGTYLNFRMLQILFSEGFSRYYMGPGNNPYKTQWSANGEEVYTMTSYAPTMRGRAGELWSEVKPRLRTFRDRLTP